MREPAIRARRGHFARLVEVAGGPDPQRFAAARRSSAPIASDRAASAARASSTSDAEHEAERTRLRATAGDRERRRRARQLRLPSAHRRREPPLDRGQHFGRPRCRAGTSRSRRAAAQMMALADVGARDGDVVRQPRAVALGPRRTVDADDRRADGRGDVRRPGVAGHHHRRAARERHEVGDRRLRREQRRAARARDDLLAPAPRSPGPHSTTDVRPCRSRSAARHAPQAAPAASACSATPRPG